jgi:hypothetical protein
VAITFNTGTTAQLTAVPQSESFTFTVPAGVAVNDVMIAVVECFTYTSASPAVAVPSSGGGNWQQISVLADSGPSAGLDSYVTAWWRAAASSDPGSTFTTDFSGPQGATDNFWWAAALGSYTGASTTSPVDAAGAAGALATSVTCPSETTGVNGDWALYLAGVTLGVAGSITGPSGAAQRENALSGANVGAALFDSNGSVGNAPASIGGGTFSTAAGSWWGALTVALSPAPVTPPNVPPVLYSMRTYP